VETAQNPKTNQMTNLLTKDQPINTENSFTPNQNIYTTKRPTRNLPKPISLSIQSSNQNLTSKTLPVTNATRKHIRPVFAKSIPNSMSFK
jgi:hypothetical protein